MAKKFKVHVGKLRIGSTDAPKTVRVEINGVVVRLATFADA